MQHFNRRAAYLVCAMVLIASVCLFVAAYSKSNPQKRYPRIEFGETTPDPRPAKYSLRTTMPKVPKTVAVLKVQEMPFEERKDLLLSLFRALPRDDHYTPVEFEAELDKIKKANLPPLRDDEEIGTHIGKWEIGVWTGGQFCIKSYPDPYNTEKDMPAYNPELTRSVADSFLERTKLLPAGARSIKVYDALTTVRGRGDKPGDRKVHSQGVSYQVSLDGVPLSTSLTVEVGPEEKVVSVTSKIRRTKPDQTVPILSPEEALNKLRTGEGHILSNTLASTPAYIDSIELVYWQPILAETLEYIMPVYIFEGKTYIENKRQRHWKAIIEAVRPEYLETKQHEPAD